MHANLSTEGTTGSDSKNNTNDWISFKDGSNLIRFLPGKSDPLEFFKQGAIHRYEIPSEPFARNYKCRRTIGEKCPLCDLHWDLWEKHRGLDLGKGPDGKNIRSKYGNLASAIKQKSRYYSVVVSRQLQELGQDPVKMVGMSQSLFDKVMQTFLGDDFYDEDDPDNTTIVSLERGNDFDVVMTKKGNYSSFEESMPKFKKTPAGSPAQIAEWMEHTHDLDALVVPDSYEKGKEIVTALEATIDSVATESTTESGEPGEIKV